tara:strand:- start:291 stop:638 length:348 start_codon:yes stop_codon:yes gene_type:complete
MSNSMIKAIKLVEQIGLDNFKGEDFWIAPFYNCRETGFAIKKYCGTNGVKVIAFAEHRNTDSHMSVFVGWEKDFTPETMRPNETTMWYVVKNEKCLEFVQNQMRSSRVEKRVVIQ